MVSLRLSEQQVKVVQDYYTAQELVQVMIQSHPMNIEYYKRNIICVVFFIRYEAIYLGQHAILFLTDSKSSGIYAQSQTWLDIAHIYGIEPFGREP